MQKFLLIIFLFPIFLFSQNTKIDSLSALLSSTSNVEKKSKISLELAKLNEHVDLAKAKMYAYQALYFRGNDSLTAEIKNEIGRLFFFTGNLDSSLVYFEKAKNILFKLKDSSRLATINISLGALYLRKGDYRKTIATLTESAAFFERKNDNLNTAKCYSNIASAFAELENFTTAIEYSEKALHIFSTNNLVQFELITLPNLATQYFKKGDTIKAIGYYNKAEKLAENLDNKRSLSLIYNNLGNLYLDSDSEKSKTYLEKAYVLKNKLNLKSGIEVTESNLGYLYLKNKEYLKAISLMEKASNVLKGKQLATLYSYLKDAYEGVNNLEKALEYSEKSRILNDSLLSVEHQKTILDIETKYETEKNEKKILQLEADNLKANYKRKQNRNLLFLVSGVLIVLFLVAYNLLKNAKRKRIIIEQNSIIKQQEFSEVLKIKELEGIDAILTAQEEERTTIAADLHDNLGSKIATLKLYIENFDSTKDFKNHIEKLKLLIKDTYDEIRAFSKNKNFGSRIDKGLIASTIVIANQISEAEKLNINVINIDVHKRLENTTEIQIFRIIQELLTNSIKHSDANEVIVQFSEENNILNIMVEDNGKGFDNSIKRSGTGLINIEKRIEKLNGEFFIDSNFGNGTTVILNIPM